MALTDIQRISFDIEMNNPTGQVAELIKLINNLPHVVDQLLEEQVSQDDYDTLQDGYETAQHEIAELEEELDSLKGIVEDLEITITRLKEK